MRRFSALRFRGTNRAVFLPWQRGRRTDRSEASLLQLRNEQVPGDTFLFGQSVMNNTMKPVKKKDGGKSMIIDMPGTGGGAGFEQPSEVQNDGVFALLLWRRKLIFAKDEVVDCLLLEKIGNSCLGPGGKFFSPIVLRAPRNCLFQLLQKRAHEAVPQREENIVLGCKMKIKGALGNIWLKILPSPLRGCCVVRLDGIRRRCSLLRLDLAVRFSSGMHSNKRCHRPARSGG